MGILAYHRRTLFLASTLPRIMGPIPAASASPSRYSSASALYDSHLHVWAKKEDAESGLYPFKGGLAGGSGKEPPMPGHAEVLLEAMEEAGVSGALIIQPGNHQFDHSYVNSVLQRYPDKFVGMLLANPTEEAGLDQLTSLVNDHGYKGVRFNPYLWPEGEQMTNALGRALYQRAGELGVPVGHMTFKGLLKHIDDITTLCEEYPDTKVIIDHFGFCSAATPDSEEWQKLYALSRYPQVYVKVSAFFRVSGDEFPYQDTRGPIRELISKFGANRLMWGSDFPWVTEKCGYRNAWNILEEGFLSPEEKEWIMGKTFLTLFPQFAGEA